MFLFTFLCSLYLSNVRKIYVISHISEGLHIIFILTFYLENVQTYQTYSIKKLKECFTQIPFTRFSVEIFSHVIYCSIALHTHMCLYAFLPNIYIYLLFPETVDILSISKYFTPKCFSMNF